MTCRSDADQVVNYFSTYHTNDMTTLQPKPTPTSGQANLSVLPSTDPITRLPILILFPHSRCNCRCLMCDIWRATTRDELVAADVARWLDEWQQLGVRRVVLSGGEALMHSHLWDLCAHLQRAGIGVTLLTTGLLLARHAAQVVLYSDDVVVSLDGPAAIHNEIRNIPRAYEKLAAGVAAVKAADRNVTVSGRCTVQRANYRHVRDVVRAAHELGLDRISFLAADVSTDAFNRPLGWDDARVVQVALAVEDLPVLAQELDALETEFAADFASGYIAESPLKLRRRLLHYYMALLGQGDFPRVSCNAPWVSTVIEADGTVRPCFFQPPLGNIHQAPSLNSLLNSPAAVAWRQGLDMARDAICRKCVCTLSLREED